MADTITLWLSSILQWINSIPEELWAIIAGVFLGSMVTQWLKRTFPAEILFPTMPKPIQVMWIRITALVLSFLPTYFMWPKRHAFWVALAVGFGTPTLYKLTMKVVYKRWPHLEERFSGTE